MSTPDSTIVGGRYELGELLGRGGMAEVRKGNDTRLGRVVAVKRLRTDLASDATFQARFRREAQSSASLNHPAIVAVYDTGEEVVSDGGHAGEVVRQPYIVMEYVAGRTLRDILREGRKILPERALEITSGVLSALDYSHRAGIIHRDIKPGNVMLTPSGDVKVMDFGIARAISDAQSTMTQTAAVVGTAQYLSPEQARGETVDSRSDVYSAGCLLYELLTGRPPFVGDSPVAVAYQHVREHPHPPSDHDPDLPPEVDAIVMKALAKRVEDRYQSAAAMRNDIERYLDGRPIQAVAPPPPAGATQVAPAVAAPLAADADDYDDERSRGGLYVLVGLIVAALVVAGIVLWPKLFPSGPEQVQVPNVINLSEADARAAIGQAGLSVGEVSYEPSETVPAEHVLRQDPARDGYADPGTQVSLVLSEGLPQVGVPPVLGMKLKDAQAELAKVGLQVKTESRQSDEPRNQVLEANPGPGSQVDAGSTVTLFYSDGPERVPNVVGLKQAEAEQRIRDAKFVPDVRPDPTSTQPKGTVVDQVPNDGTLDEGSTVVLFVSTYEPPVTPTCITPTPGVPVQPTDPPTCPPTDSEPPVVPRRLSR